MAPPLELSLPYMPGPDGAKRPYLWLEVAGLDVRGLIDTGADRSVFPLPYASALGYDSSTLTLAQGQQVQGKMDIWIATKPVQAAVSGAPAGFEFPLQPIFVGGALNILWGRDDFLRSWDIALSEARQRFTCRFRPPPAPARRRRSPPRLRPPGGRPGPGG